MKPCQFPRGRSPIFITPVLLAEAEHYKLELKVESTACLGSFDVRCRPARGRYGISRLAIKSLAHSVSGNSRFNISHVTFYTTCLGVCKLFSVVCLSLDRNVQCLVCFYDIYASLSHVWRDKFAASCFVAWFLLRWVSFSDCIVGP